MIIARCAVLLSVLAIWPMGSIAQSYEPSNSQNLEECLQGFSDCNMKQVDASEQQLVAQALRDQNFQDCYFGFSNCNSTNLTAPESSLVARAARARNLKNCLVGIGDCNKGQLSESERQTVEHLPPEGPREDLGRICFRQGSHNSAGFGK
jgi:hypothetical protein